MSHRARHQLLAFPGIIFLVLFPIILSLWIAFFWAKSEVNNQLRTFAQLALDKSELVIRQADLVSTLSGASLHSSPSKANVEYYSWLSLY